MGLLDRVKAGAEQAASTAQRQAQIVQTKRELGTAYTELGKTAYGLAGRGELSHAELSAGVEHVTELQSRLAGLDGGDAGDAGGAPPPAPETSGDGEADIVE